MTTFADAIENASAPAAGSKEWAEIAKAIALHEAAMAISDLAKAHGDLARAHRALVDKAGINWGRG